MLALDQYFAAYGKPRVLLSDNGREFCGRSLIAYCRTRGIILRHSAPYRPQTNGRVERLVRTIKERLRCLMLGNEEPWTKHIGAVLEGYNPPDRTMEKTSHAH